ncbi:MAG: hypothetical protein WDZ59_02750 [Pirellulales bacterium]
MIRFRSNSPRGRALLSRRDSLRLLLMVFVLGFVLLAMDRARQAESWSWLWTLTTESESRDQRREQMRTASPGNSSGEIDTRIQSKEPLPPGVFIAQREATDSQNPGEADFPGIVPEHLQVVEDHAFFRADEHAAWFNLLSVLRAADKAELKQAAEREVSFIQLYQQPEQYRGRLVHVRGSARRIIHKPAPPNEAGIDGYYQVVLRPADGPASPLLVYCLALPEGLAISEDMNEEVSVTGFFFKNLAYRTEAQAGEGPLVLSAPTVLAASLDWKPPAAEADTPTVTARNMLILTGISALAGLAVAAWLWRRSREVPSSQMLADSRGIVTTKVPDQIDSASVGRTMDQLARESSNAPATGRPPCDAD